MAADIGGVEVVLMVVLRGCRRSRFLWVGSVVDQMVVTCVDVVGAGVDGGGNERRGYSMANDVGRLLGCVGVDKISLICK